jgi:hypothetical protein
MIKEKLSPTKRIKAAVSFERDYNKTHVCIHVSELLYLSFGGTYINHRKYLVFTPHFELCASPTFQL